MSVHLRWVAADEHDRVALARMRAYAPAAKDLPRYLDRMKADPRLKSGDCLLAEADGDPVGTATSLSMAMWVRGGAVWCQGVAYVGTVRTHRRGGGPPAGTPSPTASAGPHTAAPSPAGAASPGVATQLMRELTRRARDREQAISALMPFRNSFYERFGYGVVERRHDWTVPTALLPAGDFDGYRHYRPADLEALAVCRQKQVCRGQCDLKRTKATWENLLKQSEEGFFLIDRPDEGGTVRGFVGFDTQVKPDGRWHLKVNDLGYEDPPALRRALALLASLKDQYATCGLSLPVDLPLNRLLRETQVPHRVVPHATADCRAYTRMQVRVLDHKAFLEAMTALPPGGGGRAVVAVHETEGHESRFAVEIADGRAAVTPTTETAGFRCKDATWAAVACGDLPATRAAELGLATAETPAAAAVLDALAAGPTPFCNEPF
jgi:predicted acetyltransferase